MQNRKQDCSNSPQARLVFLLTALKTSKGATGPEDSQLRSLVKSDSFLSLTHGKLDIIAKFPASSSG